MKTLNATLIAVTLAVIAAARIPASAATLVSAAASAPCENLAALALPHAKIESAQTVAAGVFVAPSAGRGREAVAGRGGSGRGSAPVNPYANLPAFCRVVVTLTPSADSNIKA